VSSGGTELVYAGGKTVSTIVSTGGVEYLAGSGSATTVAAGGYEFVAAGGSATGLAIDSGGFVYVAAGGSVSGVTISGGTLDLASGGLFSGATITFSGGGELLLNDSVQFGGLVAGFSGTDTIDLVDIPYVASGASHTTLSWTQLTSGANASGTLAVSEGGHAANITLIGQYAQGNFSIGAGNFGGTLVTDPPVTDVSSALVAPPAHH
jgi:autotransporter passenger strand-loop-strand repeat protein